MNKRIKKILFLFLGILLFTNFIFASSEINIIADSTYAKTIETSNEKIGLDKIVPKNGPFGKIQKIKVGFFSKNYNSEIRVKNNTNIQVTYEKDQPRKVVFVPYVGNIENFLDNLEFIKKNYYFGETVDFPSEEELGITNLAELGSKFVKVAQGDDLKEAIYNLNFSMRLDDDKIEEIINNFEFSYYDSQFFSSYNETIYIFIEVILKPMTICYDRSKGDEKNRIITKAFGDYLNLEFPYQGKIPEGKTFIGYDIYDSSNNLINDDTQVLRVYDNYLIKPIFVDKTFKNEDKDVFLFTNDYDNQNILEEGLMTGKLFSINSLSGKLEKEYCLSYSVSDDFKTWDFKIPSLIFDGNGNILDMKKVMHNWHKQLSVRNVYDVYKMIEGTIPDGIPNSVKYWTNGLIDDFGVQLTKNNTIRISTKESCPFVPYLLTMKEFGLTYESKLPCTGPIYYDENSKTYKKNENYFKASEFNCDKILNWELDSDYEIDNLLDEFKNKNIMIFDKNDNEENNMKINPYSDMIYFLVFSPFNSLSDEKVAKNLSNAFRKYMDESFFQLSNDTHNIKRLYGIFPDCIGYSNSMKDYGDIDYSLIKSIDSLNVVKESYYGYPILNVTQDVFTNFLDSMGIDYNIISFDDINKGKPWDVLCNGINFGEHLWTNEKYLIPFIDLWASENLTSFSHMVSLPQEVQDKQELLSHTENFEERLELYKQIDNLFFEKVPYIIPCFTKQLESGWSSNGVSGAIIPFDWPYVYNYANLSVE
ncbi:MAG: hypothetical protein WC162_07300 [Sphaerochaetaceae bacterium]|nr:hypothetical protein [Sphaerochaetaceae bacterium]